MTSIKQAQAAQNGVSARFAKVTVTDTFYSNPVFYISEATIIATNVHGGPITYPVVDTWGELTKGSERVGFMTAVGEIHLVAHGIMVPTSGASRLKVCEWIRRLNFVDALVEIYQWNALDTTQEMIWAGYVDNVDNFKSQVGRHVIQVYMTDEPRSFSALLSGDLITKADFANAPQESVGQMPGRVYGNATGKVFNLANRNSPAYLGFPMAGFRGVPVDENQATLQVKYRFSKNDGTSPHHTFAEPTAGDPRTAGDLWVYDPGMGIYGLVDGASYSFVNDSSKLEVTVDSAPRVFFFIRPSVKGSKNAAGFTDIYKLINGNAEDYVESTSTDYIWALECPEVSINGQIVSVNMIIDVDNIHATKNRTVRYGLWDVYEASLGAGLLNGGGGTDLSIPTGTSRLIKFLEAGGGALFKYVAADFRNHKGRDTIPEFKSGRFVTADTSDANEANLQLYAEVLELGGAHSGRDQVRMRGMALCVEVILPTIPTEKEFTWWQQSAVDEGVLGQRRKRMLDELGGVRSYSAIREQRLRTIRGMDFFARGVGQKDDGSGTITGSVDAAILLPCDIARHVLLEAGQSVNTSSPTLGNFDDARWSGGVLNPIDETLVSLGPERRTVRESLEDLCSRTPMSLVKRKKVWDCIPDDMNPHSSRSYRSTSEQVWIGPNDVEVSDFEVTRISSKDIQNSVILKYAQGYPNRETDDSYQYDNPISQMYYGKKETITVEEPWLIRNDLSLSVEGGPQTVTEWYGRRLGRQRLIVSTPLTQKFYDLEIGHVVEFYSLEDIGRECTAYRCGLLDYYFQSESAATNYGDTTAFLIPGSGSGRLLIGVSKQVDRFTFPIATAAAYTTVGAADGSEAWDYMGSGGSWNALTGVVNGNGLKSTGAQTISFTRPAPHLVFKQEITVGSVKCGPCYWYSMEYSTATATGATNDRISTPAIWAGLRFVVMKHTLPPARIGVYPKRKTLFMEVI